MLASLTGPLVCSTAEVALGLLPKRPYDVAVAGGGFADDLTGDLEALRLRIAALARDDLPVDQMQAMRTEISAIRLRLRRLEEDRLRVEEATRRALED
jgi:hypothetical protein